LPTAVFKGGGRCLVALGGARQQGCSESKKKNKATAERSGAENHESSP